MAGKIDLSEEILSQLEQKIGFVAGIYRERYREEKVFVQDLIAEIRKCRKQMETILNEVECMKEIVGGLNEEGTGSLSEKEKA